jgi:hypothetical protein
MSSSDPHPNDAAKDEERAPNHDDHGIANGHRKRLRLQEAPAMPSETTGVADGPQTRMLLQQLQQEQRIRALAALPSAPTGDIRQYLRAQAATASLESASADRCRHVPSSLLYAPPPQNAPRESEWMQELLLRYGGNARANQSLVAAVASLPPQPQDVLSSTATSLSEPFYRALSTQSLPGTHH